MFCRSIDTHIFFVGEDLGKVESGEKEIRTGNSDIHQLRQGGPWRVHAFRSWRSTCRRFCRGGLVMKRAHERTDYHSIRKDYCEKSTFDDNMSIFAKGGTLHRVGERGAGTGLVFRIVSDQQREWAKRSESRPAQRSDCAAHRQTS